jgi:hypothetical protein
VVLDISSLNKGLNVVVVYAENVWRNGYDDDFRKHKEIASNPYKLIKLFLSGMKNNYFIKIFLILFLAIPFLSYSADSGCLSDQKVVFSHRSGFYDTGFTLRLSHPQDDAVIRFTLDGSEPDEGSEVFAEGVTVMDRSNLPLSISLIATGEDWIPPGDVHRQAQVVAARAFINGCNPSPVSYAVYFINENRSFQHQIPVLSIITDKRNFFDTTTGIYVKGNRAVANYDRRGEQWERPIHLDFFETDGSVVYSGGAGVRLHGGTSRKFPQKSLRVYFRNEYGNNRLQYQVFPDLPVESFKRLILRSSGHDDKFTMIRDGMMSTLLRNTHLDVMAFRAAAVYINGEYWGIHNIRERLDKYYIQSHHDVDPENIDLLAYTRHIADQGDDEHYKYLLEFLEKSEMSDDSVFHFVGTLMDIDNYTDYKISEIIFYRWDTGNIRHWRERSPDGRWRWMMFDMDTGYGGFWALDEPWNFNMLKYNTEAAGPWRHLLGHDHNQPLATFLLRKLLENPGYRQKFVSRFADLLNTNFLPGVALSLIDEMSGAIAEEMPFHIQRWNRIESLEAWHGHLDHMRSFARFRPDIQRQQIIEFFELDTTVNVVVDVNRRHSGSVKLNTIHIQSSTPGVSEEVYPWQGIYFKGQNITLTALPAYGYEFSHWEGDVHAAGPEITLEADGDIFVKAHFKRTLKPVFVHNWLFNSSVPNDIPLEKLDPVFSQVPGASLVFESCLPGYPFYKDHSMWRKASMERRNKPTSLNYHPETNRSIPFDKAGILGLQIRQPFLAGEKLNTLIFHLPTTGYSDIVLRMAVMDERAVSSMKIDYSVDENSGWTTTGLRDPYRGLFPDVYILSEIDFSSIEGVNNNPEFKVRIRFDGELLMMDHGNRVTFNNITLEGIPLPTYTITCIPPYNGKVEPSGIIELFRGEKVEFQIMSDEGYELTDIQLDGISVMSQLIRTENNNSLFRLQEISSDHELSVVFSSVSQEDTERHLLISPNPAQNQVSVKADRFIHRIEMSTLNGQLVFRATYPDPEVVVLDISGLNNGLYVVVVYTENAIYAGKLFVAR